MLTLAQLDALARRLDGCPVLTVYLNGADPDPSVRAARRAWLDRQLAEQRASLAGRSHEEREAFAHAVATLERLLAEDAADPRPAPGWVAWIPADGAPAAERLPVPVPSLVRWDATARVAPYAAAAARNVPVLAVVVDSRRARLYRVVDGQAEHVETLRAPALERDDYRQHGGARGGTSTDDAERRHRAATERLLADLARWLERHAASGEWVALGGVAETARRAFALLPPSLADRVLVQPGLHLYAVAADVTREALAAAATLRDMRDIDYVGRLRDRAGADELAALGDAGTERALAEQAVGELVLTEPLVAAEPERVEQLVRRALAQGAAVHVVSGPAAARLTEASEGTAALLRFSPYASRTVAA